LPQARERSKKQSGDEELHGRAHSSAAMPPMDPVTRKELAPTRPREAHDVLQIGSRRCEGAGDGGIERPARNRKEEHGCNSRADLELAVEDVLVRHPVTREV
jgi:hypothetical protein